MYVFVVFYVNKKKRYMSLSMLDINLNSCHSCKLHDIYIYI